MTDVVAALIWRDERILICQRPIHKKRASLWEYVGGKVEPGESKQAALIRECREELGIQICVGDLFVEVIHEYPDMTIRLSLFNATIESGEPVMLEHQNLRWVRPEDLSDYDFCPADKCINERIQKFFIRNNKKLKKKC